MLIKVKALNYNTDYTYAPPQEDAVINTDDIQSVQKCDARGWGPFVCVTFTNGNKLTCAGVPGDFVPPT